MALPSTWNQFLAAIRAQESGGNYNENVAGCLGAYCWNAQSNWDDMARAANLKQYVGQNPSTLPAHVQDQVASANLYAVYQQVGGGTGGYQAAAQWWNGGSTSSVPNPGLPSQPWAPSCGSGSSGAYACQVLTRMRLGGHYVAGAGSGSGGTVQTQASGSEADCLWSVGWGGIPGTSWLNKIFGLGGNVTSYELCLLSRPHGRAIMGGLLVVGGTVIAGLGLGVLLAAMGRSNPAAAAALRMVPGAGAAARSPSAGAPSASGRAARPGSAEAST